MQRVASVASRLGPQLVELATNLSDALGDAAGVTLIDQSDHFMFGFSKLDIMFGALGDGANTGASKAGVFAERAAKAVASALIASVKGGEVEPYDGFGACYIEFGAGPSS